jgi:hypothetical protein
MKEANLEMLPTVKFPVVTFCKRQKYGDYKVQWLLKIQGEVERDKWVEKTPAGPVKPYLRYCKSDSMTLYVCLNP